MRYENRTTSHTVLETGAGCGPIGGILVLGVGSAIAYGAYLGWMAVADTVSSIIGSALVAGAEVIAVGVLAAAGLIALAAVVASVWFLVEVGEIYIRRQRELAERVAIALPNLVIRGSELRDEMRADSGSILFGEPGDELLTELLAANTVDCPACYQPTSAEGDFCTQCGEALHNKQAAVGKTVRLK